MFLWKSKVIRRSQSLWLEALLIHPSHFADQNLLRSAPRLRLFVLFLHVKKITCAHTYTHTLAACVTTALFRLWPCKPSRSFWPTERLMCLFICLHAYMLMEKKHEMTFMKISTLNMILVVLIRCVFNLLYLDDLHVQ